MLRMRCVAAGVFALASTTAYAESKLYFSAEAGITRYGSEADEYGKPFNDGSLSNESIDRSNRSRGAQLGWQIKPNWAVELGYIHLGEYEYSATSSGAGAYGAGELESEVEYEGATLGLVYRHPLTETLAVTTRLGAFDGSARKTLNEANGERRAREELEEAFGGLGLQWQLGNDVRGELGYQYYGGDAGINSLGLRLQFLFD